jgi:hypothetical protein
MFRSTSWITGCAVALAVSLQGVEHSFAQYTPPSGVSGAAKQQLQGIYNQSVGVGYSSAGLLQLDLSRAKSQVPYFGQQSTTTGLNRSGQIRSFGSASRVGKPFSNYSSEPTVSPYLNLFRRDFGGNDDLNYNTLVRPMLQQQQLNQQLQRQNYENARRLQAISAQANFNPAGSKDQVPTGHQTAFQYYGHYYPGFATARRQR